jgi:hypothetical protein
MSQPFLSDSAAAATRDYIATEYLDTTFLENKFLNWVKKEPGTGKQVQQVINDVGIISVGADDVAVIAGAGTVGRDSFFTPWIANSAVANVSVVDMELLRNDDAGVVEALGDANVKAMRAAARDLERSAFGDGFGTVFIIGAHAAGSGHDYDLTMKNLSDAISLQVGSTLVSSAANNSSSLDSGSATVVSIDRDTGIVGVNANSSWAPTDGHYVFSTYNKKAGAYSTALKIFGLDAWLPRANRTTTFGQVDRSKDPQSLSGCYVQASAKSIRAAVNTALARVAPKADAKVDTLFMSPNTLFALTNELNNKYEETSIDNATVNAKSITFMAGNGRIQAIDAWGCPDGVIYGLAHDTWVLRTPNGADLVKPAGRAGKDGLIDVATSANVQVRMMSLANLSCAFPGGNFVLQLT